MSIDTYKAEAQRLATHLADVHGVKLHRSSALNAVAALHGARNWNSLIGSQAKPGLFQRAVASLCPSTPSPTHEAAHLGPGQHALVVGPEKVGDLPALDALLVQQLQRGGGLLVLDTEDSSPLRRTLFSAVAAAGRTDVTVKPLHRELLDVHRILCSQECVYLAASPSEEGLVVAQALLQDLKAATVAVRSEGRSSVGADCMVVLPATPPMIEALGAAFFAQARAFGVTLLLHTSSLVELEATGHAELVRANTVLLEA